MQCKTHRRNIQYFTVSLNHNQVNGLDNSSLTPSLNKRFFCDDCLKETSFSQFEQRGEKIISVQETLSQKSNEIQFQREKINKNMERVASIQTESILEMNQEINNVIQEIMRRFVMIKHANFRLIEHWMQQNRIQIDKHFFTRGHSKTMQGLSRKIVECSDESEVQKYFESYIRQIRSIDMISSLRYSDLNIDYFRSWIMKAREELVLKFDSEFVPATAAFFASKTTLNVTQHLKEISSSFLLQQTNYHEYMIKQISEIQKQSLIQSSPIQQSQDKPIIHLPTQIERSKQNQQHQLSSKPKSQSVNNLLEVAESPKIVEQNFEKTLPVYNANTIATTVLAIIQEQDQGQTKSDTREKEVSGSTTDQQSREQQQSSSSNDEKEIIEEVPCATTCDLAGVDLINQKYGGEIEVVPISSAEKQIENSQKSNLIDQPAQIAHDYALAIAEDEDTSTQGSTKNIKKIKIAIRRPSGQQEKSVSYGDNNPDQSFSGTSSPSKMKISRKRTLEEVLSQEEKFSQSPSMLKKVFVKEQSVDSAIVKVVSTINHEGKQQQHSTESNQKLPLAMRQFRIIKKTKEFMTPLDHSNSESNLFFNFKPPSNISVGNTESPEESQQTQGKTNFSKEHKSENNRKILGRSNQEHIDRQSESSERELYYGSSSGLLVNKKYVNASSN